MEPIIRIRNLTTYFENQKILDDISADIQSDDITVILGRSGCGKTTLLKHIIRLFDPVEGSIEIFNQNIASLDEEPFNRILRDIGVLFQNGALFNSLTVGENVAIPLEQHTDLPKRIIHRIVREKLHLVELDHAIHYYPSQLSGGMRKRAALARAIALDPKILFGDEPSAGLDPMTAASLDHLLLKLRDYLRMTVIVVTHELSSIRRIADRVLFMESGKLLFDGKLAEAEASREPAITKFFNP